MMIPHRFRCLLGAVLLCVTFTQAALSQQPASGAPQLHDSRLELSLFAHDPDIVTPIGAACDSYGRLFVIESHTHNPPRNYNGPKSDQIKVFEDSDGNGTADLITLFAEGFKDAMNLAFAPGGELYVVCAREVWALRDSDGDRKSDSRRRILELKTSNTHSHSALMGIAFGPDGRLYISRGNNGSAKYSLVGTDGSSVSGYGDGGNIVRCHPDGSKLEEFATGFWNPFDIKFDSAGRLICVDNDPDARGPNRLLHVVQHGDYGYKSLYGGSGNHPFQGWEGELPGTLPMIDGTGEAPSGVLDCAGTGLPDEYTGSLLITIWNENTITRHVTKPSGVSLTATNTVLISGPADFRPVAFAPDGKGAVYITDWVLVDYPNHGRGRIWKLTARNGQTQKPRSARSSSHSRFESVISRQAFPDKLEKLLASDDPFVRHAAVIALARQPLDDQLKLARDRNAAVRLGALLALRRSAPSDPEKIIRPFLDDADADIRRTALIWAGEETLTGLEPDLHRAIQREEVSAVLLETYLAAIENLDPKFVSAYRSRANDKANQLKRALPPGVVPAIINNAELPPRARALAVTRLGNATGEAEAQLLKKLVQSHELPIQLAAIQQFAHRQAPDSAAVLRKVVDDRTRPSAARAEALVSLSWHGPDDARWSIELLSDPFPAVQVEAARLLRYMTIPESQQAALDQKLKYVSVDPEKSPRLLEALRAAASPGNIDRPTSIEDWQEQLSDGGEAQSGARVFFSAQTSCSVCHTIDNRGGKLGPDLSSIAQSVDRSQLIHSILRPSDQFPPHYQTWFIKTNDEEIHEGLQLDHASGGLELFTRSGKFEFFPAKSIDSYGPLPRSLMPDGLEQTMTIAEFRDLLAFLESRK